VVRVGRSVKESASGQRPVPASRGTIPEHEFLFRDESYALLTDMLEKEQDPTVLYSVIPGLGHLDNALAIPFILRYQDSPLHRVRYAATFALGCFPNDARFIEGLLLARDSRGASSMPVR
jgi:hypothetical protein